MITVPKLFLTLTIIGMVTTMFLAAVGSTLYLATMTLMLTVAVEAQVHATLALVEQQRIANIVARLGVLGHLNRGEHLSAEGVRLSNRLSEQLAEYGLS